jgi:dUTPase
MDKDKIVNFIERLTELNESIDGSINGEEFSEDSFMSELNSILLSLNDEVETSIENVLPVKIKKLREDAVVPSYSKDGDAGMDITATHIISNTTFEVTYGTGLAFEVPKGYMCLIFPRSSIKNYDLFLSNSVGVLDCVPSGTKIKTINGDINVEDLFNDITTPILSYNEEFNSIEKDRIDDMWVVENKKLLKIETDDNDIIEIPYEKEVFTRSGWKKAINLAKNDEILRYE